MNEQRSAPSRQPRSTSRPFMLASLLCVLAFSSPATIRTVTNTADSGAGSLRDTIGAASAGDIIQFSGRLLGIPHVVLTSGELVIGSDLTIGGRQVLIDGNKVSRVFNITAGTVTLSNLTITNGLTADYGGGVFNNGNLTVNGCTFSGNQAHGGGAMWNQGTLTVTNCTFAVNIASVYGGGIESLGTMSINNSTFYGNASRTSGGGGGGIANFANLTIHNSTFDGNTANSSGGGLFNYGNLTLKRCTLSENGAATGPGGGLAITFGSVTLQNTIIAGNFAGGDVSGAVNSLGFNLIGTTNGSSGWNIARDQMGSSASPLDARLGPLQNNGGATLTMVPLPGSGALDAATADGLYTDQAGQRRPFDNFSISNANGGDGSDIGAYEVQGPTITSQPQPASQFVAAGQNITWTVSATDASTMSYQWSKDGVNIAGATSSSYTRNNVQPADAGNYSVVISNPSGASTGSSTAFLNVGFALTRGTNGEGVFNVTPEQSLYTNNQSVTLTAVPADGWVFTSWTSPAGPATVNPRTVTMNTNKFITANFSSVSRTNHVTNLNDSGPGSLRAAIAASVPGATIDFRGLTGTIVLTNGELLIGTDLNIVGTGQTNLTVRGFGGNARIFNITAGIVSISGLGIANGYTLDSPGGGIYNAGTLILEDCVISNNAVWESAGGQVYGGGIYNSGGTLSANHCNFIGNFTGSFLHSSSPAGGAIYNDAGIVSLSHCAFSDNSAVTAPKIPCYGGALYNGSGTMSINNCTLATNSVRNAALNSASYGGAIFNAGTLNISNSTIAANSASAPIAIGGGIYQSSGTINIQSSIVAYNYTSSGVNPDVFGFIASQGFNLIGQTNGSRGWLATDLTGSTNAPLDPMLGSLTNNGGPSCTMALLPGSPAIDRGYSGGIKTDQRGAARPFDNINYPNAADSDGSDIGAYEAGLNLTLTIVGGGIVLKDPDLPSYAYNQKVTLTAIPAAGWNFANWAAEASGTANPVTVIMTGDKYVTGRFTPTTSACAPAPAGLVGWWPGAGNGNDLVSLNNGLLESITFASGRVGQAFSFNGSDSDVILAPSPSLQFRTQFTIEAWIYPLDVNSDRQIFSAFRDTPSRDWHYQMGLAPEGALRMDVSGSSSSYESLVSSGGLLAPKTWSHVAATFNGGLMTLFVNGNLVASKYASFSTIYYYNSESFRSVMIGCTPQGNQRFYGLIDEMSAYNRALAPSEIRTIASAGSLGKCMMPVSITGIAKSGINVSLSWLAQRGVSYRAQYKSDLNPAMPWLDLPDDVSATSGIANKVDNTPAGASQRFYRVERLQ